MLTSKRHPLATQFWNWYIRRMIKTDFHELTWEWGEGCQIARDRGTLLLANHCSWWDGFWLYEWNRRGPQKRFHVMMLEEQLQERQFLRYAGAYSIDKSNPRSMVQTLQHTAHLLQKPENLVLLFPQGRIESSYSPEPTFQKGAWRVLQQMEQPPQILTCISTVDYFSERKPSLRLRISEMPAPKSADALKQGFYQNYQRAYAEQGRLFS